MSATSAITPANTVAMVMRYVSRFLMWEISCARTASSSRFGIVAQQARRHADVARRRPEAGGERVRRVVVDDAHLRRHREPRADRHVLDEAAQRPQLVRADRLRVRDARDHAARAERSRTGVDEPRRRARRRRARRRSASPTRPARTTSSRTKPRTTMLAAQAVPPDLLLQRHVAGVNETCGTAVSPSAEKNSFAEGTSLALLKGFRGALKVGHGRSRATRWVQARE